MRLVAYEERRRPVATVFAAMMATAPVRQAVAEFRHLVRGQPLGHELPITILHQEMSGFGQQRAADAMQTSEWHPASIADIEEHIMGSQSVTHPEAEWAVEDGAEPSLCAAVRQLAGWKKDAVRKRERLLSRVEQICENLEETSRAARAECSPQHLRCQMAGPEVHVAAVHALAEALGVDPELGADFCMGFRAEGEIPTSGWFAPATPPSPPAPGEPERERPLVFDDLDHDEWNTWLEGDVALRAERARAEGGEAWANTEAVFETTVKEIDKRLMDGFFLKSDLDGLFGVGGWRAIRRFGVYQRDKCRACDNAKESGHNRATTISDKLHLAAADFPARVAALFSRAMGDARTELRGGTDDIEAAYRRMGVALPQFGVVALYHPGRRCVVFATMSGFNFGKVAAGTQFNRYSRFVERVMRAIFAWCGCSYFDDFCTVEPAFAGDSGQRTLAAVMRILGVPLANEKHVPMSGRFTFLGVETNLAQFAVHAVVELGIAAERAARLIAAIDAMLEAGVCAPAEAARMAGRLGFASSWAQGRFGRALMQPLYRQQEGGGSEIGRALRYALLAFLHLLRRGWRPRRFRFDWRRWRPTVKIWTDAAWEPESADPAMVAFVVFFPAEGRGVRERWVYGYARVPDDIMARFCQRVQYIGQLEILAAIAVYYSLPELYGRQAVHWIDNTGAVAALVKGYARAPDSVRMVHAFAAFMLGRAMSVWFEYVPSKANIADLPSRFEFTLLRELGAEEVEFVFPPFASWDEDASYWLSAAEAGTPAAEPPAPKATGKRRR